MAPLHHARLAPDLFPYIVEAISEDFKARPTLVALATTCWAFHVPAVAALWRSQPNLTNLVRTMPADLLCLEAVPDAWHVFRLSFTRPLLPDDWHRFDYYAARIRKLDLDSSLAPNVSSSDEDEDEDETANAMICLSPQAYGDLAVYQRSRQLLPNLRALRWSLDADEPLVDFDLLCFIQLFVGNNLLHMSIDTSSDENVADGLSDKVNSMLSSLLPHIATVAPNLVSLDVELGWVGWECINSLGDTLRSMERLQNLKLDGSYTPSSPESPFLSGRVLGQIALLPNLQKLSLHMDGVDEDFSLAPQSLDFPALKALELDRIYYADYMIDIVHAVRAPLLEALAVELSTMTLRSQEYLQLASAISQAHSALRSIVIVSWGGPGRQAPVGMECLRPYLTLKMLEAVTFSAHSYDTVINDEDVRTMATSWSHLRRFVLQCKTSIVTLEGLRVLVCSCPNLTDLTITMKLELQHPLLGAQTAVPVNAHITHIDFHKSRISQIPIAGEHRLALLAGFLHCMFPNLTSIKTQSWKQQKDWEKLAFLTYGAAKPLS